jgi:hypothetical protein
MNEKEGKVQFWRLLKIDEQLRAKRFPTARSLAKDFDVSKRTVERDIEFLRDRYEAPIEYDHSKCGYAYTQETFFLKSLFLTDEELFSAAVFEKALQQYRNTPIEGRLKAVFAKLTELLPDDAISVNTMWLGDSLTFIPEPSPEISPEIFDAVFSGVKARRAIRFLYRSLTQTEAAVRTCEPYHIVCQRGAWYVIGRCADKNEERIFSFSRMSEIEILKDASFELPAGFTVEQYIDKNVGVWLNRREPFTVRLLFSASVSAFAEEHIWNEEQTVLVHEDKSVEVSFKTTQFEEMKRFVLGQGATVRVLEPAELVQAVQKEIEEMRSLYQNEKNPSGSLR